mmetsp:Transcript_36010/g.58978  ORF Transcript_36010/g.58978 Transcript_36010/m.58978 type:complete len:457 (-) Transcript_36010:72-1442(-)
MVSLALLHHQRTLLLRLLHLGLLIAIGFPQAAVQDLRGRVMDLLPAVETAALAQGTHRVGEGVVDIVEQHLVPTVLATQDQRHHIVEDGPGASRVLCQELVPRQRVGEVGNEHPSQAEANTSKEGHGEHEPPSLAQGSAQRIGPQEPDAGPEAEHEAVVLHAPWDPLAPKVLVALATCTLIWEVHPPLQSEEGSSVVQAKEVDHRNPWHSQDVLVPVGAEGPCPLLQSIVELLGIPTELALDQQIHGAGVVAIVLQDELLPGQGEEIREGMSQELLKVVDGEGGPMHHVVIDVDLLDRDVGEGDAKAQGAAPPMLREGRQGRAVAQNHQHLSDEDGCQDVPHVDHLLWGNLGEQESQILRHRVWLVGGGKEPIGLQTPVLVVLLHLEHLVLAGRHAGCIGVSFTWQQVLQGGDLVVVLVLLFELLQVLIGTIENGRLGVANLLLTQKRCVRRHEAN